MQVLLSQADGLRDFAEVIAFHNHGETRLPVIRHQLLHEARGDYVAFIDDDDMVPGDYMRVIGKALTEDPDTVGFEVALTGGRVARCSHRLYRQAQATGWNVPLMGMAEIATDPGKLFLHPWGIMTPTRRSLAVQCSFASYGPQVGEDGYFRDQLLPLLRTEVYIPRPMYDYRWDPRDSVQTQPLTAPARPRFEIRSPVFRYHPRSSA